MDRKRVAEKVMRAKIMLEGKKPRRAGHSDRCMIDLDPDYYGPCTCGADKVNAAANESFDPIIKVLDEALDALMA